MIALAAPMWLAVIGLPLAAEWLLRRRGQRPGAPVASISLVDGLPTTWRVRLRQVPAALRWVAMTAVALTMTSPSRPHSQAISRFPGLDIVLLVDVSQSMRARDAAPDRLGRAVAFSRQLVQQRSHDRFGVVLFAGENALACPLTSDHAALLARLEAVEAADGAGTALGAAILGALKRLPARDGGVVVVLTDGTTNTGAASPVESARMAAASGVRLITVAVGHSGTAAFPTELGLVDVPLEVDEATLQAMATVSNGIFVNADSSDATASVTRALASIEPRPVVTEIATTASLVPWLVVGTVALLALEVWFSTIWLRTRTTILRLAILIVGAACAGLAVESAARGLSPPWGEAATGAPLVFVLDVSRSMDVDDLRPTRRRAAEDLVGALMTDPESLNAGLVVFSGESLLVCPVTSDSGAQKLALADVANAVEVIAGGSALAEGIARGVTAVPAGASGAAIVLLSDGEDTGGELDSAIAQATARGIAVHTVGMGTAGGRSMSTRPERIPGESGPSGQRVTTLQEDRLRDIAATTGGRYVGWSDAETLPHMQALLAERRQPVAPHSEQHWTRAWVLLMFLCLAVEHHIGRSQKATVNG